LSNVGKVSGSSSVPSLRLDAAARELLARRIDTATQVELASFADAMDAMGLRSGGLDPASLTAAVFAFIMPRLSNPAVLRLDRRRALIQRMLADGNLKGGAAALRQELRGIDQLRGSRDSLVGG